MSRHRVASNANHKLNVVTLLTIMLLITSIIILVNVAKSASTPGCRQHNSDNDDDGSHIPPDTGIEKEFFPNAKPLRIVTKNEWLAQAPRGVLTPLKLPVDQVIIVHTATEGCSTQTSCVYRVRFIQEFHIGASNYSDISYNFLIGGDGHVYEGRGWLKVGSVLRGQNSKSIGIAFIGDYRREEPTKGQLEALNSLLEDGISSNYLTANFKLYGASQFQLTESPGKMLYEQVKKLKHWSTRTV